MRGRTSFDRVAQQAVDDVTRADGEVGGLTARMRVEDAQRLCSGERAAAYENLAWVSAVHGDSALLDVAGPLLQVPAEQRAQLERKAVADALLEPTRERAVSTRRDIAPATPPQPRAATPPAVPAREERRTALEIERVRADVEALSGALPTASAADAHLLKLGLFRRKYELAQIVATLSSGPSTPPLQHLSATDSAVG
eukprot:Rhum_TRINITY_DN91_c0_g1::Rhum_TRINITY_DN91_c0_g1_i1::g.230::m.230